jgi:hypothetical protein
LLEHESLICADKGDVAAGNGWQAQGTKLLINSPSSAHQKQEKSRADAAAAHASRSTAAAGRNLRNP